MTTGTRALARSRDALARLDRAASCIHSPDLVLYRSARGEAMRRGEALLEHAPGVPALDPREQPPIAAVLRGEAWLAGGRPGGWIGLACDLHWELMQAREATPGTLRSGPAWQGGSDPSHARHRYPEASAVPGLLAAWERALEAEREPLLLAADALARFALVHPFRDGNGRVAQALVPVVLRAQGLLSRPCLLLWAVLQPGRPYFTAIDRFQSGDERPWVSFFLSAIERAATDAAAACEAIRDRFVADARRLPEGRARRLLWRLAEGALPLRDVVRGGLDGLRTLREARIARVARGLYGEPIVFHVALARIVAARIVASGGSAGRVS